MAYMNQERKAALAPGIKEVLQKYGLKGTISTDEHSIAVNIAEGPFDFIGDYNEKHKAVWAWKHINWVWSDVSYIQVNVRHIDACFSDPMMVAALIELRDAMNAGNHDNSDLMSDYFDVGWYLDINIGKWNKSYRLIERERQVA